MPEASNTERVITTATPNLPIRENLEGKSKRVTPDLDRSRRPSKKPGGHDSPPEGYPHDRNLYADPANYRYPLDTEERVRAAWSYINVERNCDEFDSSELSYIKARIRAAAKRFGIKLQDKAERLHRSMELSMKEDRFAPFQFYVPIARVDDDERIVEGYAYCNAEVGDGWNLKREALEAAASDYMRWGAIRVMHQPVAAGTAKAVDFDDNGAFLRAKIVDDNEWRKVKEGVYKGFSIGGKPKIVRGKDIEVFDWVETSLVDRPADPDAVFTLVRMEGTDVNPTEVDMTLPEELMRGTFPPKKSDDEEDKKKPEGNGVKQPLSDEEPLNPDEAKQDDASGDEKTDPTATATDDEKTGPTATDDNAQSDDTAAADDASADATADDASATDPQSDADAQGDEAGAETLADKLDDATDEGLHDFSTKLANTNTYTDQVLNETLESLWMLHEVLSKIAHSGMSEQDKEVKARTSIQQFADHVVPKLRGNVEAPAADQKVEPVEEATVEHENDTQPSTEVGKQDDTKRAADTDATVKGGDVERTADDTPAEGVVERAAAADESVSEEVTAKVPAEDVERADNAEEVTRVESEAVTEELPDLQRLQADNEQLVQRVASVEAELARVQGLLATAEERVKTAEARVKELENSPARMNAPVRFPEALERSFAANGGRQVPQQALELQEKLEKLQRELPGEHDEGKRLDGVREMQRLKMDLARFGVTSFSK